MTRRLAAEIGLLAGFTALAAFGGSASAQDAGERATMVLCGAEADGVRNFAVGSIERATTEAGLDLTVAVEPRAKVNLMKLALGDCHAAIVQLDSLVLYKAEHMSGPLMIAAPLYLFDRYLHLICRRETGIETVEDLLRGPQRYEVLIGEAGSASEITWTTLTRLDMDYRRVETRQIGGLEALAALTAGEDADCMVRMDGIGTAFMDQVEAAADRLRLVPIDLFKLRDAEMVENRVYRAVVIPPDTYVNLQADSVEPAIETIAVGIMLITDRSWARAYPAQHEALIRAVTEARQSLLDGTGS